MLDVPLPSSLYQHATLPTAQSSTSEHPFNFLKTQFPPLRAFRWWRRRVVALPGVGLQMEESKEAHSSADLPLRATINVVAHVTNHVLTSILDAFKAG